MSGRPNRRKQLWLLLVLAAVTCAVFAPTLRGDFLVVGFDGLVVIDDPDIQSLSLEHLRAIFTKGRFASYVPLSTLWLAAQYHLFGPNSAAFHAGNILLHVTATILVAMFVRSLVRSNWPSALAALIFSLHPLQVEAVALPVQCKTLLCGVLVLATLLAYQRWRQTGSRRLYWLAVLLSLAAVAAKPAAVAIPALLVLYDYTFVDGRFHIGSKMPFVVAAAVFSLVTLVVEASFGAVKPPHGGNWLAHFLVLSRVTLEMVLALFLPLALSPIYYYPRSLPYELVTFLSLIGLVLITGFAVVNRRRIPWTFFGLAWFAIALAPQSNIVPLAQLRADRFVYLSVIGFAVWLAVSLEQMGESGTLRPGRVHPGRCAGALFVVLLAGITISYIPVWRSDISAWGEVVARHGWCSAAHLNLARAYVRSSRLHDAERAYRSAIRIQPKNGAASVELADLYLTHGLRDPAAAVLRKYLELVPEDAGAQALLLRVEAPIQHGTPSAE